MTVKEFLNQAYEFDKDIESNKLQIERLRVIAEYVSVPESVKIHGQSFKKSDHLENTVALIVDLEAEIIDDIQKYVRAIKDIRRVVNAIADQKLKLILQNRYLNFMKWNEIADNFGCSVRRVLQLHGFALIEAEINFTKFHLDRRDMIEL